MESAENPPFYDDSEVLPFCFGSIFGSTFWVYFCGLNLGLFSRQVSLQVAICMQIDEFSIQNDEFCISNDELCIARREADHVRRDG